MSEEEKKNATDAAAVPSETPKSEVDKKPESGASKKKAVHQKIRVEIDLKGAFSRSW